MTNPQLNLPENGKSDPTWVLVVRYLLSSICILAWIGMLFLRLTVPTFELPLIVHGMIGVFIVYVVTGGGKAMTGFLEGIIRAWRGTK